MYRIIAFLVFTLALTAFPGTASESIEGALLDKKIIAACLILEASDQGREGMQGVASVIANRSAKSKEPYIKVVTQPYAFTALNKASTDRTGNFGYDQLITKAERDLNWKLAMEIVEDLYNETLQDNTYGADHYSRKDELPSWSHRMRATTVIGDHLFFKR